MSYCTSGSFDYRKLAEGYASIQCAPRILKKISTRSTKRCTTNPYVPIMDFRTEHSTLDLLYWYHPRNCFQFRFKDNRSSLGRHYTFIYNVPRHLDPEIMHVLVQCLEEAENLSTPPTLGTRPRYALTRHTSERAVFPLVRDLFGLNGSYYRDRKDLLVKAVRTQMKNILKALVN